MNNSENGDHETDALSSETPEVSAMDLVSDAISGLSVPSSVKRNAAQAFARLCSAAIEVPAAYLEGMAEEKRATTKGRVKLIETNY